QQLDDVGAIQRLAELSSGVEGGHLVQAVIDLPAHQLFATGGGCVVALWSPDDPVVPGEEQGQQRLLAFQVPHPETLTGFSGEEIPTIGGRSDGIRFPAVSS